MLGKLNFKGTVSRDFFLLKKLFEILFTAHRGLGFFKNIYKVLRCDLQTPLWRGLPAEMRTQDGRVLGQKRI